MSQYFCFSLHVFFFFTGPWNIVAFAGIGAYVGSKWTEWEDELYRRVNEKRVSVGYKPIARKESP